MAHSHYQNLRSSGIVESRPLDHRRNPKPEAKPLALQREGESLDSYAGRLEAFYERQLLAGQEDAMTPECRRAVGIHGEFLAVAIELGGIEKLKALDPIEVARSFEAIAPLDELKLCPGMEWSIKFLEQSR